MARCTAPVRGHRTSSGRAQCPRCGGGYSRGYGGYGGYHGSRPSYSPPSYASPSYGSSRSGGSRGSRTQKPRWSSASSAVYYTSTEVQELEPVRANVEAQASRDVRDIFLCHAWNDRKEAAKELYDLLIARGVKVWFSEEDIQLGVPFLREIDKGLAKSRVGIVLVTPHFINRIRGESIADKELSVLLHRGQLVPIIHGTTFDALNEVSPMLASRNGLSTSEETMAEVAAKLAEVVKLPGVKEAA
ncbi:MAG: toll/interleukin-1 receptor domain-containing protein [Fimbriimonadaceae bacterium]|nr:toll/interleukin-1 receptor domain-containing protein [Fimbriimonadaceae bacterium]